MGLAGYYRKFVEGLSKIAAHIIVLQRKERKFDWIEECEEAFNLLKQKLTLTPMLTIPDPTRPFTVITNASGEAIGGVLM